MKKLLKYIGGLFILMVLLAGVLLLTLISALRPEPVAPIASTPHVAAPVRVPLRPLRQAESGCSIQVQVVDVHDDPVAGAAVTMSEPGDDEASSGEGAVYATDIHGWTESVDWPCEVMDISAADGMERTRVLGVQLVKQVPHAEVTLTLEGMARIFGTITDEEGAPIEQATLTHSRITSVATGGRYEIWVPVKDSSITFTAPGYQPEHLSRMALQEHLEQQELSVEESPELEHDLVLLLEDRVEVFCAGLPGDRCSDIALTCSKPLLLMGGDCSFEAGRTLCACPSGEAAVRGGGRATLIGPDDTEAWLDFRDTGSLSGRIVESGLPVTSCALLLFRLPNGLEDLPRGVFLGRSSECEADGTFTFNGLVSGDWELHVKSNKELNTRLLQPVHLQVQEHKDIGDVEVWEGGGIEGVLIDGLTGEPTSGVLLALRQASGDERTMPAVMKAKKSDGVFLLHGIPAGSWRVFSPMSPHRPVTVVVEEGVITDGVEVITSETTVLQANGFSLTREDDLLTIEAVAPGSPADDAGLRAGDVIVGIRVAGFDLNLPESGSMPSLAQFLLGNYDGPGVTVLIEQDGEPLEASLEW